ncbi:MAG TPA: carboxypeptidase regulatory-like domain-containing protein [Vicinamibacteria bacterium]|nr:carboxypeptidase regulatory-like domain-containing protein [Vicinamibacteria bacterium]
MHMTKMAAGLAAAAAVLVGGPDVRAAEGVIKGRVLFEGTPPAPQKVKVSADPRCKAQHPDGLERSDLSVSGGGLGEALVYLKTGVTGTFPPSSAPALLDQKGCQYLPAMVAVQAGQPLKIRNSDPTLHNVHFRPALNPEINIGQPRAGMESSRVFAKPEVLVPIGCDVHPWMRAHLAVLSHPFFAVTVDGGAFEIRGVPPGSYQIEARHPRLPPASAKVTVGAGVTPVDLTLSLRP